MFLTTKTIKEELIMTQLQFNLDFDEIKEKVINSSLDDILKSTIVIVLNEFMKQERDEYLNVRAYERSDERRDYRNGYYPREMMMNIVRSICVFLGPVAGSLIRQYLKSISVANKGFFLLWLGWGVTVFFLVKVIMLLN